MAPCATDAPVARCGEGYGRGPALQRPSRRQEESNLTFNRRQILKFLGAGAALFVLGPPRARALLSSGGGTSAPPLAVTPVRLPHPLPIYERMASFLATGLGAGESLPPAPGARLDAYTVIDDVVVPPEYERYVIVHWNDGVFPHADDYVGYNADYTAFLPIGGRDNDGYLWVNHEYVSYPISSIAPAIPAELNGRPTTDLAVLVSACRPERVSRARRTRPPGHGHRRGGAGAVVAFPVLAAAPGAYDAVRRKPPGGAGESRHPRRVCRGPSGRAERAVAGASAGARLGDRWGRHRDRGRGPIPGAPSPGVDDAG
jgi:hypothetical protein